MATSDFWDVHVTKYGYPSLRWSWVCEGRSETRDGDTQMWPAKIMDQPYKYSRYDELNKSIKAVAQKLRKRRLDLKRMRPWYAGEYAFWSRTIYGETTLRSALSNLTHSLYGHSLGHEYDANGSIKRLLQPHSRVSDLEAARPEKTRTSKMFYHAMGFLGQAALPVRAGTVTYKTGKVAQYPDRLRPAMRPGFAGNTAMMDSLIAQGESSAKERETKTLYDDPAPSHDRELCMSNARLAFLRWQVLGVVSHSTAQDFEREWQLMRRQLDQAPLDDRRLEWSPATWDFFRSYSGLSDHEVPAFFRPGEQMEQQSEGVDADIPAGAIARPAIPAALTRPAPAVAGVAWIPYYDSGEVGDHTRLYSSTKWGCVWDGREMAVYDITDLLVDGSWSRASRARVTRPSLAPLCREVHTGRVGLAWRARFQTERPIGYVTAGRRKEDVRINDGKERRPRWVMVGEDVYDVTNIELPLELQDLEAIIAGASDQDPIADAVNRGYHPDVIRAALRPYRIGWVKNNEERRNRNHYVFTDNEVKWHTTRETGVYLIIRGKVYDFTKFIDQHPGGSSIIEQAAGTDATSVWDRFHGTPFTDYKFDVHAQLMNLEIGTVVKERFDAGTPLAPTEIRIRNLIFSKDRVDPNDRTFDQLDGYWGSDGTADMEKLNPPKPYLWLWENPGLIVAKVRTPLDKLPYMGPRVLEKMDGKAMPNGFNESYVSSGRYVYNLTCDKPSPFLERLKEKAGTVLNLMAADDRELNQRLFATCSHRIIGLLSVPKHGHDSAEKAVAWKTSYRRAPGDTPKAVPQAGGSAATPAPVPQPYTVRPLYPLRRKRRKTSNDGAGGLFPNPIESWLSGVAMDESMGEPMDESMDNPVDDSVNDPMDLSRTVARMALDEMGFPV
ncbi:cytochrome b5-like Heme/Steroid binding domain-containing protein [Colletotrichum cereale]|nr:cytochrome b5-like Heme/Steroid binding domain-containing protein [Colletotrichum cereale]